MAEVLTKYSMNVWELVLQKQLLTSDFWILTSDFVKHNLLYHVRWYRLC